MPALLFKGTTLNQNRDTHEERPHRARILHAPHYAPTSQNLAAHSTARITTARVLARKGPLPGGYQCAWRASPVQHTDALCLHTTNVTAPTQLPLQRH